jgi:thiamine-phosphate pyrophosphorylase
MVEKERLICVTHRQYVPEPEGACGFPRFLAQLARVAALHPRAVVLREKELSAQAYCRLARQVQEICAAADVPLVLHHFRSCALSLGVQALHLPLPELRALPAEKRAFFRVLGTSCHSFSEVQEAEQLGCTYVFFGHVFPTDCKPGVPARGIAQLAEVCRLARVPVYAIGGVTQKNLPAVLAAGAAGGCSMSGFMRLS